jgi:predicted TIM-barrel fold metal-dependent hydrolase
LTGNHGPGYLNYWNPNGVHRADAVTEDGGRIEGSPVHLARQFFDVYQIEFGILNPENILGIGLSPEPDYAAAQASAINDVFVEEWLPVDPRFRYSLAVTPNDPALAAREIQRLGGHPGVVQVLLPGGARMPYGQRYFHPIYAAAVEHGLPVAIHPGTEGVGISGAPTAAGYPGSYLEWHTGLVGGFIAHLVSLVTEGVFVKFPGLKIVLVEGGVCWLPPLLWRLDKNWRALRQTVPWLDRPPSEIVFEHVFLTTQPLEEPDRPGHFHSMLGMFPADRMLLFSSDFPHWDGDTPDFTARNFPAPLRDNVMHGTARALYQLPSPRDAAQESRRG